MHNISITRLHCLVHYVLRVPGLVQCDDAETFDQLQLTRSGVMLLSDWSVICDTDFPLLSLDERSCQLENPLVLVRCYFIENERLENSQHTTIRSVRKDGKLIFERVSNTIWFYDSLLRVATTGNLETILQMRDNVCHSATIPRTARSRENITCKRQTKTLISLAKLQLEHRQRGCILHFGNSSRQPWKGALCVSNFIPLSLQTIHLDRSSKNDSFSTVRKHFLSFFNKLELSPKRCKVNINLWELWYLCYQSCVTWIFACVSTPEETTEIRTIFAYKLEQFWRLWSC